MIVSSAPPPERPAGWTGRWPPLRINPLDRLILRGRDPYYPVMLVRFERMRYAVLLTALVALLFTGLIAWSGQQKAKQVCLQRNAASVQYRKALEGLAAAAERRGDRESASIYRTLTPRAPIPNC
jgi:hypothetical protein